MNKKAKKNIDKKVDVFGQYIREVFWGRSSLDEAREIWKETTKRINERKKDGQRNI